MEQKSLDDLVGWKYIHNNKKIHKAFAFKNFSEALAFTNRVGVLADAENHHPEIKLSWGKVVVTLWTHSEDDLTEKDFSLAEKINRL